MAPSRAPPDTLYESPNGGLTKGGSDSIPRIPRHSAISYTYTLARFFATFREFHTRTPSK